MEKIALADKFKFFNEYWSPRIVGELNDNYLLLAKLKGEFMWHKHENEDELFVVVQGKLVMHLRDQIIELDAGELFIVPRGVEHLPLAEEEVYVMLIEPKTTKHTGEIVTERTVTTYQRI